MSYQETNKKNFQALIDFIQTKPGSANSIDYIAAGRMALLGKGHAKADQDSFNPDDCYKGKISLSIAKDKKEKVTMLSFTIQGKKYYAGKVSEQNGGRSELETAIKAAVPTTLASIPVGYTWL
jgi:uncharacterized protein VirK/YbjX